MTSFQLAQVRYSNIFNESLNPGRVHLGGLPTLKKKKPLLLCLLVPEGRDQLPAGQTGLSARALSQEWTDAQNGC